MTVMIECVMPHVREGLILLATISLQVTTAICHSTTVYDNREEQNEMKALSAIFITESGRYEGLGVYKERKSKVSSSSCILLHHE